MRRAGPLAINYFVKIIRIVDFSGLHNLMKRLGTLGPDAGFPSLKSGANHRKLTRTLA